MKFPSNSYVNIVRVFFRILVLYFSLIVTLVPTMNLFFQDFILQTKFWSKI